MLVKKIIEIFILFSSQDLFHSKCNAQSLLHFPCNKKPPATPLTPFDFDQLIKFFEHQQITPKILDDIIVTKAEVIKDLAAFNSGVNNEDIHAHITELIKKYGYPVEEHEVQTEDGYLLTMQRIPGNGPVVFLMHGLFASADDYVTAGPESALAYFLAAKGCDVWMGNSRGNHHSKKHVSISLDCAEFWDFSFEEVGLYDLPAMIDYVLDATKKDKLTYIGHAQGNTAFFVMASELPEYGEKVSVAIAISPVAWMTHMRSPAFRIQAVNGNAEYAFLKAIGLYEIWPDNLLMRTLMNVFCGNNALAKLLCSNLMYFVFGFDRGQWNVTNLPVNLGHMPAGASTKQIKHYVQEVQSGRFCRFDYVDSKINLNKYNSALPPDYPVEVITTPVALFYSNTDWISNITDVLILKNKLQNVVDFYLLENYWHFDYLWAKNVNELVNPQIYELILKFQ